MKKMALFLTLVAASLCLPATSQTLASSVRIDRETLSDSIHAFAEHRTPEAAAYFRSLKTVEEAYWPVVAAIDSTVAALMADPATRETSYAYADSKSDIMMEYDVLLKAVVLSHADEIMQSPSVQASVERARAAIRDGADADRAWKIARQGLEDLPRYKNRGKGDSPENRRLVYEFAALNNALSTLTLHEFDRLIRERDGKGQVRRQVLEEPVHR